MAWDERRRRYGDPYFRGYIDGLEGNPRRLDLWDNPDYRLGFDIGSHIRSSSYSSSYNYWNDYRSRPGLLPDPPPSIPAPAPAPIDSIGEIGGEPDPEPIVKRRWPAGYLPTPEEYYLAKGGRPVYFWGLMDDPVFKDLNKFMLVVALVLASSTLGVLIPVAPYIAWILGTLILLSGNSRLLNFLAGTGGLILAFSKTPHIVFNAIGWILLALSVIIIIAKSRGEKED